MANYSAASAVHATLTASTVDEVTLDGPSSGYGVTMPTVTVVNRTGGAEIYFTVSTSWAAPAVPAVEGDNTFVLPAAIGSVSVPASGSSVVVRLISSGAEAYSVEAL